MAEEGVRALRGGESDAWGTLAAGALTGALLVGLRCERLGGGRGAPVCLMTPSLDEGKYEGLPAGCAAHACLPMHKALAPAPASPPPHPAAPRASAGRPYALLGAVTWGPACAGGRVVLDWLQPGQVVRGFLVSQGLLDEAAPASPPTQQQRPWRDVREAREAAASAAAAAAAQQAGGAQASRQERQQQQQQQQQEQQKGWWWRRTRQLDPPTDPTFEPAEAELEFEQLTKRRQVSEQLCVRAWICGAAQLCWGRLRLPRWRAG